MPASNVVKEVGASPSSGFLNEDSLTHAYSPYLSKTFGKTRDFHNFLRQQRMKLEPYHHRIRSNNFQLPGQAHFQNSYSKPLSPYGPRPQRILHKTIKVHNKRPLKSRRKGFWNFLTSGWMIDGNTTKMDFFIEFVRNRLFLYLLFFL